METVMVLVVVRSKNRSEVKREKRQLEEGEKSTRP